MFDQEEFEWDMLGLNSSVSLPPQELLDLADQLDVEGIMQSVGGWFLLLDLREVNSIKNTQIWTGEPYYLLQSIPGILLISQR